DKLRDAYDTYLEDAKKARKDSPFGEFTSPPEEGRRAWVTVVEQGKAPDHGVYLSYDNWEPREVGFAVHTVNKPNLIGLYQGLYDYYSQETLQKGTNPYDLERRDDSNSRDYDLTGMKGTIELALDDAEQLNADVTFTFKAKRDLHEVPFFI